MRRLSRRQLAVTAISVVITGGTSGVAFAAADALNNADPPPPGQEYLYGLTPDGASGVVAVCVAGELSPQVRDWLAATGGSEEGVPAWRCESRYARPAEGP